MTMRKQKKLHYAKFMCFTWNGYRLFCKKTSEGLLIITAANRQALRVPGYTEIQTIRTPGYTEIQTIRTPGYTEIQTQKANND